MTISKNIQNIMKDFSSNKTIKTSIFFKKFIKTQDTQ